MEKRGIAPIIATVLLIVIVVAGVALLVTFVIPMIKENMVKAKACSEARLNIEYACHNGTHLSTRIARGAEEFQLEGAILQIINSTATTTVKLNKTDVPRGPLEAITIIIRHESRPDSVGIAPLVKSPETQKPISCEVVQVVPVADC